MYGARRISTRRAILLIGVALLHGCASVPREESSRFAGLAPRAETAAPFFAQQIHHCGPATLASLLHWSGMPVTPEELAEQVYLPERQGTLQIELAAAARRHGRLPYQINPTLEALFREIGAGHPVIVLQNLGLAMAPRWHYAVLIGYDLDSQRVTLQSGPLRRQQLPLATFFHTWNRAGRWALLVLPPQRLPATAEATPYLAAAASLEAAGQWHAAETAYRTAREQWPQLPATHLGLANALYEQGQLLEAETALREAVAQHESIPELHNNLAFVLLARGALKEAETVAERAVSLGGSHQSVAEETLTKVRRRLAVLPP